MKTVKDIIGLKGNQVWTITPDAKVLEALALMAEKEVGALVALDSDRIAGIISERDYARKVILKGLASRDTLVRDIMSSEVYVVNLETTMDECMALMTDRRIRHLPVCIGGKLAGVISIGDVVKAIITEQNIQIQNLENYILGKYPA